MGHDRVKNEQDALQTRRSEWIETFRRRSRCDLRSGWYRCGDPNRSRFIDESWGREHRPDWAERGLLIWPRGRQWLRLAQELRWPEHWDAGPANQARLALSWWAECMRLWVNGVLVHEGDLFDTACRWRLPDACRSGDGLLVQLELCSPGHDDGALICSSLCLEPVSPQCDADLVRTPEALELHLEAGGVLPNQCLQMDPASPEALQVVQAHLASAAPQVGLIHWLGHAHLDLAWLWPVADTWVAAERTFRSALALLTAAPDLHFAHSTPALYAWLQKHRPLLFNEIRAASRAGRWEPINGPWVESDCVLVSTASLWQQFQTGQAYSKQVFPEWSHALAWLPDSFGFGAGLPGVAARNGIRWFCTHKLAWNADHPFPHRLFRWRGRGGDELLALMLPPIGRRGDPLEMLQEQRSWHAATGVEEALWIPGVGDHGGGPTQETLDQMCLWDDIPQAVPRRSGTVRGFLETLEPLAAGLPVWRDELYLELHRGCGTSRPDQKRHNRALERLLREQDAVAALLRLKGHPTEPADWRALLFQQFHDILPGTSIPEVFDQAEPIWRAARRGATAARDAGIQRLLQARPGHRAEGAAEMAWLGLQPLAAWSPVLRVPDGVWQARGQGLPQQAAFGGGAWVQLPRQHGVSALVMKRSDVSEPPASPVRGEVKVEAIGSGVWTISNHHLSCDISSEGVLQLRDCEGHSQLAHPLKMRRFRDRGEFWDAWDLPADYRQHPLPVEMNTELQWLEQGPLVAHARLQLRIGSSACRLDVRLCADGAWLELVCTVHWQQRHELLRLELPLAQQAVRFAADTSGGVLERPAHWSTDREQARWEVPVISWMASQTAAPGGGLAMLLDGPQGADGVPDRMGVSLLRGPTWPDPSADQGVHRHRLGLMPLGSPWSRHGVPQAALAFREPGWWGPADGVEDACFLPGCPKGLVPLAMLPDPDGVALRVLNPGASRCEWEPGMTWTIRRRSSGASDATNRITIQPGELTELILRQSS